MSTPLRCRTPTRSTNGLEPGQVVVLLNAGASAMNINILQGDQSVFTRDFSLGGNAYTEALQKELDLPFDAAEQLKKGIPVDGATFEEARPVLRAVTENVLVEVQKTFDFYKATASSDQIDRIVLSGGASRVDGFAEMLESRFGTPVEYFDPFRTVAWDAKTFDGDPAEAVSTAPVAGRPRVEAGGGPVIRINLLGVERQKFRSAIAFDIGQTVTVACSLILVTTVLLFGWWYWSIRQDSSRVDTELVAARQEAARPAVAARRGAAVRAAARSTQGAGRPY